MTHMEGPALGTRRGITTELAALALIALVVVPLLSGLFAVSANRGVSSQLTIVLPETVLQSLFGHKPLIGSVTLSIPGVAVVTGQVMEERGGYTIIYDLEPYKAKIERAMEVLGNKMGVPTVVINLVDYDTGKRATVAVSTVTEIMRDSARQLQQSRDWFAALANMVREDPFYILKKKNIIVDQSYLSLLKEHGYIVTGELSNSVPATLLRNIIGSEGFQCSGTPFPTANTGVWQVVNWSLYNMLVYGNSTSPQIPDWWIEHYIDHPNNNANMTGTYKKFVKDLLSSYYIVDRSVYSSANDAVQAVHDFIAWGYIYPDRRVNIIDPDILNKQDDWIDSMKGVNLTVNLPILSYKINNKNLKISNAALFVFFIEYAGFTAYSRFAGFMFDGSYVATLDNAGVVNVGSVNISVGFEEQSSKKSMSILIKNTKILFGDDMIFVKWHVYDNICPGKYIIVPTATIATIYAISYDAANVVIAPNPGEDEWYYFRNITGNLTTIYPILFARDHDSKVINESDVQRMYVFTFMNINNGDYSGGIEYDAVIDLPPIISTLLFEIADSLIVVAPGAPEAALAMLVLKTLSYLSSTGVVTAYGQANGAHIHVWLMKTYGSLSKSVRVTYVSYETRFRFDVGVLPYYPVINITAMYENNSGGGGIGCGPTVCPFNGTG